VQLGIAKSHVKKKKKDETATYVWTAVWHVP